MAHRESISRGEEISVRNDRMMALDLNQMVISGATLARILRVQASRRNAEATSFSRSDLALVTSRVPKPSVKLA